MKQEFALKSLGALTIGATVGTAASHNTNIATGIGVGLIVSIFGIVAVGQSTTSKAARAPRAHETHDGENHNTPS